MKPDLTHYFELVDNVTRSKLLPLVGKSINLIVVYTPHNGTLTHNQGNFALISNSANPTCIPFTAREVERIDNDNVVLRLRR